MKQQIVYDGYDSYLRIIDVIEAVGAKNIMLVCGSSFDLLQTPIKETIDSTGIDVTYFRGFSANPDYLSVVDGVKLFEDKKNDFIISVGGGSAIDVAKCIALHTLDSNKNLETLEQTKCPHLAMPTTAGSGSEATHFAAIYKGGEKHSIADEKLLPDYVVLQPDLLKSLPAYQKKCTMLDALCQAIESWWSRKSTPESIEYSREAIKLILDNMYSYLKNEDEGNQNMLIAANLAGKAINITTTTAPHAMCYKLTSSYGLAHGHAAALCLPKVWRHMGGFDDIAKALGKQNDEEAIMFFEELLLKLEILPPENVDADHLDSLADSVNIQRLNNNPKRLNKDVIKGLYREILEV